MGESRLRDALVYLTSGLQNISLVLVLSAAKNHVLTFFLTQALASWTKILIDHVIIYPDLSPLIILTIVANPGFLGAIFCCLGMYLRLRALHQARRLVADDMAQYAEVWAICSAGASDSLAELQKLAAEMRRACPPGPPRQRFDHTTFNVFNFSWYRQQQEEDAFTSNTSKASGSNGLILIGRSSTRRLSGSLEAGGRRNSIGQMILGAGRNLTDWTLADSLDHLYVQV